MSTSISATEIGLPDNAKLKLGTGEDLEIFHNGSQSKIIDTVGNELRLNANTIRFRSSADDETYANFIDDGSVELYHNNSKKLSTESYGVLIHDAILEIADTSCLIDLMETGTTNHRLRQGSGNFMIQRISDDKNTTTTQFHVDGGTGSVSLYHEGTKKLSTQSGGICFNNDTAAANALNDYEEGTFTPSFANVDNSVITVAHYNYTKVGRLVHINARFDIGSNNDGSRFGFQLPFTQAGSRRNVLSAISTRSGNNTAPFAFIIDTNQSYAYANELDGFGDSETAYATFSGDKIFVTGTYESN